MGMNKQESKEFVKSIDSQIKASLLSFVIGDAMGVPIEFLSREELRHNTVTTMTGYGSHPVPAGTWSDDTSMTLATMKAIVDSGIIDYTKIMDNFTLWADHGEFTADGKVFDMGITCRNAILNYENTKCNPIEAGMSDFYSNGNGSLMRMLPIALYCHVKKLGEHEIVDIVNKVSSLTHSHEISCLGCYLYVKYTMFLLAGESKQAAYEKLLTLDISCYSEEAIATYERVLNGNLKTLSIDEIKSSGYVVHSLEASLWVLLNTSNFKQAIIGSINLGEDTDTIGAITGSLAGLVYGMKELPVEWIEAIRNKEYLLTLVSDFTEVIKK